MIELKTFDVFPKEVAESIKEHLKQLDNKSWTRRTTLGRGRGIPNEDCKHDWIGHVNLPKSLLKILLEYAPQFEDYYLQEICANRYNIGDYLGKHKDMHLYRKNVVVSLQQDGDGLIDHNANKFIEDKIGQGVIFTGVGPLHEVPPVKQERFVVIYLYQ